jgi:hypothetical protein
MMDKTSLYPAIAGQEQPNGRGMWLFCLPGHKKCSKKCPTVANDAFCVFSHKPRQA